MKLIVFTLYLQYTFVSYTKENALNFACSPSLPRYIYVYECLYMQKKNS